MQQHRAFTQYHGTVWRKRCNLNHVWEHQQQSTNCSISISMLYVTLATHKKQSSGKL